MKKKIITSLFITAILTGCSTNNYDGLAVVNVSNSGCSQMTRNEGDINHSTLKLTRDGNVIQGVLNNYMVNCVHGDIIVNCDQEGQDLSIVVSDLNNGRDGIGATCLCPVNIYFTIQNTEGELFHVALDKKDLGEVSFKNHSVVEIDIKSLEQAHEEGFDYSERLSEIATNPMEYHPEEMPEDKPRLELIYNASEHTIYGIYWYFHMPCNYTKFDMTMDTDVDGALVFKINTDGVYSSNCDCYSQIIFKMTNAQKEEYNIKVNPHKVSQKDSNAIGLEETIYDFEGIIKKDTKTSIILK